MDKDTREFLENIQNGINEFRNEIKNELQDFRNDVKGFRDETTNRFDGIEDRLDKLEVGQGEIKTMVGELDPKNANRHIELQDSIFQLRKDLSTVEILTASNYSDLSKLKSVK
jgi:hypothetical protein